MVRKCAVWAPDDCDDNCGTAECPLSVDQIAALDGSYAPAATNVYVTEDALPGVIGASIPMRLAAATLVGATSIEVESVFGGVVADSGWVVIDPYTVECEIRKVTNVVLNVLTIPALVYAHALSDLVLWVPSPVWSPILFGAVYDGVTDDSPSHQAAIDDAPDISTIDFSGPGTSRLASPLTITDKSLKLTQPGNGTLYQNYVGTLFEIQGVGTEEIIIEGIVHTSSTTNCRFFRVQPGEDLRRLIVKNNRTDKGAFVLSGGVADLLYVCHNNVGDGSSSRPISLIPIAPRTASNIICNDNYVIGSIGTGTTGLITIGGDDIETVICCNNHVRDTAADGYDLDSASQRSVFIGNIAENCVEVGFDIKPGAAGGEGVTCVGNVAIDCGTNMSARASGAYSKNVLIATVASPLGDRMLLIGPTGVGSAITVEGNYIESVVNKPGIQHAGTNFPSAIRGNTVITANVPIRVDSCLDLVIENNYCEQTDGSVSNIQTQTTVSSNLKIRNNTLVGGQYCVRVNAGWTDVLIYGNDMSGWANAPTLINAGATVEQDDIRTFNDNDATPSVVGGSLRRVFICSHTLATNITNFDNGLDGQPIEVHFTTANATLVDGANIMVDGSANYNAPAGTIMQFRRISSVWYEVSRSNT